MEVDQSRLEELRTKLHHGEGQVQTEIDDITASLRGSYRALRPKDKEESLPLFSHQGDPLGLNAPRWLCHLLGLRHRCAHILLLWTSPALHEMLLLQIRNWSKDDSPGQLDISVGGHMTTSDWEPQSAALTEMLQELSLQVSDLQQGLEFVGGYGHDESRPAEYFYNSEWRDVYIARLSPDAIERVRFPDGEVAGIVLIPVRGASSLLAQTELPIASALRCSLPRCLERLQTLSTGPAMNNSL